MSSLGVGLRKLGISPFLFVGLLSGLVAAIFGCIWEPLGYPWGLLCRYTLIWTHNLAAGFERLAWQPFVDLWTQRLVDSIFYAGVLLAIGWNVRTRMRNVMLWSCLWTSATLIMYVMAPTYPEQLTVTFIDVGMVLACWYNRLIRHHGSMMLDVWGRPVKAHGRSKRYCGMRAFAVWKPFIYRMPIQTITLQPRRSSGGSPATRS